MEKKDEVTINDYKTISVRRQMEMMTADAYECLGWELVGSSVSEKAIFSVNLLFKRNRKVSNKKNLLELQEKVDTALKNIEILQRKKKNAGLIPALTTGIIGALTFGGGMSMILELGVEPIVAGWLAGGIALGLVGIGICALAWLVNRKARRSKIVKIDPLLEMEYNKLSDLGEEAKKL